MFQLQAFKSTKKYKRNFHKVLKGILKFDSICNNLSTITYFLFKFVYIMKSSTNLLIPESNLRNVAKPIM